MQKIAHKMAYGFCKGTVFVFLSHLTPLTLGGCYFYLYFVGVVVRKEIIKIHDETFYGCNFALFFPCTIFNVYHDSSM